MELRIENLTKAYGKKVALNDFTATLSSGIYGLLGPNGAGKSTMMKILTENLAADGGRVLVNGVPSNEMGAEYRALLGYMPQQQGLYPHFTARRFLYYIAALKGMTKAQAAAMEAGSMFGWHVPGADPKNYDDNGLPLPPGDAARQRERQMPQSER